MIRLLVALLFVPALAFAETRVRTAEHGPFTRVVIDYDSRLDPRVTEADDTVRIQTRAQTDYDLSDVYRRIDDKRVRRITQDGDGLSIELACSCKADPMELPTGALVIDIREVDADLSQTATVERADEAQTASGAAPGLRDLSHTDLDALHPEGLLPGILTEASDRPTRIAENLRDALLADLAAGASDGVSLRPGVDLHLQGRDLGRDARSAVGGQISIDTRRGQNLRGERRMPAKAACVPVLLQDISDWLDGPQVLEPAANKGDILAATAKQLIIRGFGVEALGILDATQETVESAVLREIARIVDAPVDAPLIADMADCSGLSALFAALADPPVAPARPGALVAAIEALPAALARIHGKRASDQLKRLGQDELAAMLRAAAERRHAGSPISEQSFTDNQRTIDDARDPALIETIARRTPEATAAMAALMTGFVDRGETVPPDVFEQASIMLREAEDDARTDLERAMIAVRIAQKDVRGAGVMISALEARVPGAGENLRRKLGSAILNTVSDADFLRGLALHSGQPVPDATLRLGLAERALDLGMPHLAEDVLSTHADTASEAERILQATAQLDQGNWNAAATILNRLSGPEVDTLKARLPKPALPETEAISEEGQDAQLTLRRRGSDLVAETEALRAEWGAFLSR